ncbi:MAG TPA: helix-turn-helix domain-containing protein, partial [Clostridiales bacterium]|nr:helix-turn-helix domain-containing protein [Clostridiales bacterium]
MYESITYAELKSLPREQKVEALKELMATHSSQKKIAEKLGVNPPNIYSMVSRYIREDADTKSRKKKSRTRRASVTDE